MRFLLQRCLSMAFLLNFFVAHSLIAGGPTEQLQTTIERVLAALAEAPSAEAKDRQRQVRGLIHARFDFVEMAKRSPGTHWKTLTADEQSEFVRLFSGLLEATAMSVIDSFGDAKIHYRREVQETGYSRVETKVVTKKGDELAVDYNLQLVDGEWKVYDVAVENISMVNNYRFQFGRIIADASFKDLVRRIKEKQARILAMKSAGIATSALRPINIRDDSRPLIFATLIGSSRDRQLIPRP